MKPLHLGNLGFAPRLGSCSRLRLSTVRLMLQRSFEEVFVIATGSLQSVRDFVVAAGLLLNMRVEWRGKGVDEVGIDANSGRTIVHVDPRYFRPTGSTNTLR